jgi:hypothetical protein
MGGGRQGATAELLGSFGGTQRSPEPNHSGSSHDTGRSRSNGGPAQPRRRGAHEPQPLETEKGPDLGFEEAGGQREYERLRRMSGKVTFYGGEHTAAVSPECARSTRTPRRHDEMWGRSSAAIRAAATLDDSFARAG